MKYLVAGALTVMTLLASLQLAHAAPPMPDTVITQDQGDLGQGSNPGGPAPGSGSPGGPVFQPSPEPSTLVLAGMAAAGVAGYQLRRK